RVAAEDVADRELIVAEPGRRETGGDLGQRGRGGENGRPEHHPRHAIATEKLLAAAFDEHAGHESDDGGSTEDRRGAIRRHAVLARLLLLLGLRMASRVWLAVRCVATFLPRQT